MKRETTYFHWDIVAKCGDLWVFCNSGPYPTFFYFENLRKWLKNVNFLENFLVLVLALPKINLALLVQFLKPLRAMS